MFQELFQDLAESQALTQPSVHSLLYTFFLISSHRTGKMSEIDPDTLLEWLTMGQGDERDMQLIALEQLCMLLLMSDNVDRCFERYVHKSSILKYKFLRIIEI